MPRPRSRKHEARLSSPSLLETRFHVSGPLLGRTRPEESRGAPRDAAHRALRGSFAAEDLNLLLEVERSWSGAVRVQEPGGTTRESCQRTREVGGSDG